MRFRVPRGLKGEKRDVRFVPSTLEAGDIAIVHNDCVHQHFNASEREPARALVIKTKPMYLFMNMLFQHTVEKRPKTHADSSHAT
jgi:hypothetical protein